MIIYFSQCPEQDADLFGDDGLFKAGKEYFYNGVEHGTNPGGVEEVRIFDGCGRSIPISVEEVPRLVEALNYCYNNYQDIQRANKLETTIDSNAVFAVRGQDTDWPSVEEV